MTVYQPKDFMHECKLALKEQRKRCPDVKVELNNPPYFVCLDKENTHLAVRLRYIGNGIVTESHYNVAIQSPFPALTERRNKRIKAKRIKGNSHETQTLVSCMW